VQPAWHKNETLLPCLNQDRIHGYSLHSWRFLQVFSDEFEQDGRLFNNGYDPRWTSINKNDCKYVATTNTATRPVRESSTMQQRTIASFLHNLVLLLFAFLKTPTRRYISIATTTLAPRTEFSTYPRNKRSIRTKPLTKRKKRFMQTRSIFNQECYKPGTSFAS
jgi:hypothetical protein